MQRVIPNLADFQWWHAPVIFGLSLSPEILSNLAKILCESRTKKIEMRGKHLDKFERIDLAFINFNRFAIILFIYHLLQVCLHCPTIERRMEKISFANTAVSLATFYVVYDFFYTIFHGILHHRLFYKYVHKHHHRQHAPSRGTYDAINVHPFEYLVGEYLHILTVYLVPTHVVTVIFFVVVSGVAASLNHTRFDINIPGLYSVKNHDVHHRLPTKNYGQYIMLWDKVFGSYDPYKEKD